MLTVDRYLSNQKPSAFIHYTRVRLWSSRVENSVAHCYKYIQTKICRAKIDGITLKQGTMVGVQARVQEFVRGDKI